MATKLASSRAGRTGDMKLGPGQSHSRWTLLPTPSPARCSLLELSIPREGPGPCPLDPMSSMGLCGGPHSSDLVLQEWGPAGHGGSRTNVPLLSPHTWDGCGRCRTWGLGIS